MSSQQQSNESASQLQNLNKLNPIEPSQQEQSKQKMIQQNSMSFQVPARQSIKQNPQNRYQMPTKTMPKKQLNLIKQNKPRLIIDHMVLKNFKSYAGVQKIGPFHKNFTSIVGPNGSGKSNLIQSMLFIFGFSASWMRLKNLSQLIHNSAAAKNLQMAAVQVHFKKILDNHDGTITQIPQSAFFIRRTVNQSSVSKYFINGEDSSQLQVKTKLKSEGIDLTNNRFLILQGQVQQISQMKQKSGDRQKPGFLQYLEDIIGSNQFIDQIQQAVKQYATSEQLKHQRGQRMKLVENQLRSMTSQKQQAIKFVKKERKLFQIQTILHQVLKSNSNYQLKKGLDKIGELEKRKDQIIKEQKQKMTKQAEKVNEIKRMRVQIQKIDKQVQKDQQKINQLSAQDKNIKAQIEYNSEDQVKYEKITQNLHQQFTKIVQQSNQIKQNLPQKQKKLHNDKKQLEAIRVQLAKYDRPELRQKIKSLQNQLKKISFQKSSYSDKKQTLTSQIQKATSSNDSHTTKISQYKIGLQKNLQTKAKIQIALQIAQKQLSSIKKSFGSQKSYLSHLRNQHNSIQFQIKQKKTQNYQQGQFNNMFNHIMKAKIPGVLGRLGDLGTVDNKYDEVVTTSCLRLDNVVVENYQSAQQVLALCKRANLGRVTCIILDKITQFNHYMAKPFNCPDNAVRIFDLIKIDQQQARVAFYFALSNTLFCQDSDYALKLAMGDDQNRRRVISRNRRGGFMMYQMNGLMNSVSGRRGGFQKKAQKKTNNAEDKELQKKAQELFKQLQIKANLCKDFQKQIRQIEDNFQIMRSEKVVVQGKIKQIQDQIKDIQKMTQKNQGRKQSLESMKSQIKAIDHQLQKTQVVISKLQKQLMGVQNQQKKYETAQISKLRQKNKQLRAQYVRFQKQVQKQQAILSSVQKRIKQNKQKEAANLKTIQKIESQIQKGKDDMLKLQNIGLQLYNRMQKQTKRKQQMMIKQEEIKKGLQDDQQTVRESKRKIQEARAAVDLAKKQIRKAQEDMKFAISELERIRKLYQQMTSTYDFLSEIDSIQNMSLDGQRNNDSSILDVTILSTSMSRQQRSGNDKSSNHRRHQNRDLDVKKIQKVQPLKDLTQQQLDIFLLYQDKLRSLLGRQSTELKKMQGKNLSIISQYRTKYNDYKIKQKQFDEVKGRQVELKKLIDDLKEQRFTMFREGFSMINSKLKEVYQLLTNGGDAQMELIDSLDPFSDGVNFSVRPPKKAWKQINKLSGGQKTLSSLSLIFALHYYKPTPLYFMDQIDAALDFKNVSIVGDYIKRRTKDAQFIIISLRNNMFDLADKLVGVYKTHDITKVINLAVGKILLKKMEEKREHQQRENVQQKSIQL